MLRGHQVLKFVLLVVSALLTNLVAADPVPVVPNAFPALRPEGAGQRSSRIIGGKLREGGRSSCLLK